MERKSSAHRTGETSSGQYHRETGPLHLTTIWTKCFCEIIPSKVSLLLIITNTHHRNNNNNNINYNYDNNDNNNNSNDDNHNNNSDSDDEMTIHQ